MNIQPINNVYRSSSYAQKQTSFNGLRNLSQEILKSDRRGLINIAEFFHNSSEEELHEITRGNKNAYDMLKEAIDGVITRKKCYIADGAEHFKQKARELSEKAMSRKLYYLE